MRIAVWSNLPSGGGKRALYDHSRGLAARGHELAFWSPDTAAHDYMPLSAFGPERHLPVPAPRDPRLLMSVRGDAVHRAARLKLMEQHCAAVAAEIDAAGFDVVLANSCSVTSTPPLARFLKTPALVYLQEPQRVLYEATSAGSPFAALESYRLRARLSKWYWRDRLTDLFEIPSKRRQIAHEVRSARLYRRILVNSYFSRESVLRCYGLDARVCYLGVDASAFTPAERPRRDAVVGVGSFMRVKNIDFVVRALALVPPPRPPLIWVGNFGDSKYLAELVRLARECGVAFDPRQLVTQAELTELLGHALAAVQAPRLEPFGYGPLEANACGTPVVAAAEGGLRETVVDGVNGFLVDPTPGAMAGALVRLRDDPALVERLGGAGRASVGDRWSLDSAAERLERHLRAVAAGEPS